MTADSALLHPAEVDYLRGDSSYARQELGWEPDVAFEQLVNMMVKEDLQRNRRHILANQADVR